MTKAIIFDCFGVLTVDLWKEFMSTLTDDQKRAAHLINHAYDRGEITQPEFIKQVEDLTGKTPGEVERVRNSDGNKNHALLEYISTLKPKYKIGLLSNIASNWIREVLLTSEEQKMFDDMVFSYEVKMTKPDPAIFRLAAERLGVKPSDCVLIDDIETYCLAARQEGMKAIVYQNFEQTKTEFEKLLAS
jgi:epoxide hydrolase-like predicted phosphatase